MTGAGGASSERLPFRGSRQVLSLAAVAVGFAAADTYVVVVALPDMMSGVGLSMDELQRAAPIVSGFLLGYVAMLPLIGRIADLRGRAPVLVASLVVFSLGSLVTAAAYDLPSMVVGRFLQGVGAGGLVPATLALVADIYAPARRGVPLGVVGAVQELGSVLGPLYGALVLSLAGWQVVFWLNLAVGVILATALHRGAHRMGPPARPSRRLDLLGAGLASLAVASLLLVLLSPPSLTSRVNAGLVFLPLAGESRWLSPLALLLAVIVAALLIRSWVVSGGLIDLRSWVAAVRQADLLGSMLLCAALAGIVLAFATADPEVQVFSRAGPWLLVGSTLAAIAFAWHNRRARQPLVPVGALRRQPAWGALMVSLFVGSALIAALVDIPVFARVTVYPDSQMMAALVLVRLLVPLPVGALAGGYLTRRVSAGAVTAAGMVLAAGGFLWMAQWGLDALLSPLATLPLVMAGLGFGLALAPVNAALLAATETAVHGVTSALLVVARMVGMLVGISALTTIGLRRYYTVQVDLPAPTDVCAGRSRCAEYTTMLKEAGLEQLHTVFLGAAVCAVVAGMLALLTFRTAQTRGIDAIDASRPTG